MPSRRIKNNGKIQILGKKKKEKNSSDQQKTQESGTIADSVKNFSMP